MKGRALRAVGYLLLAAIMFTLSCSQGRVMRGKIEGLEKIANQAERNGAIRCAPRELAMAKSHLRFALIELDQGYMSKALGHIEIAEPNTHAAYSLSPPQVCAERGFVMPTPTIGDPDTDGDGLTDSIDQCILDPEDKDGYLDDDGCPDIDNDLDGVLDGDDKLEGRDCKNDPEDPDGYEDEDGCPEPDNDKDKVVDLDDICPNEPGPPGGDRPGCPKKPSLAIVTDKEIKILQQIHFAYDKDVIRKESFPVVDAVADILKQNPKIKIEVQGHTDNRGSKRYNLKLSDRRANSVRRALIQRGIDGMRLTAKGYGMGTPIVPNDTAQNRALNRRVQFIRTEK